MYKIISITLIAALAVFFLCSDLSADDYTPWIREEFGTGLGEAIGRGISEAIDQAILVAVVSQSSIAVGLTIYNVATLRSNNPNRFGGIFGTVWGATTTVCGVALLSSGEEKWIYSGLGVTALGVTCTYYGVKSLARVRAKYLESKELGLSIDPVIIGRGRGKADVGFQLSLTF